MTKSAHEPIPFDLKLSNDALDFLYPKVDAHFVEQSVNSIPPNLKTEFEDRFPKEKLEQLYEVRRYANSFLNFDEQLLGWLWESDQNVPTKADLDTAMKSTEPLGRFLAHVVRDHFLKGDLDDELERRNLIKRVKDRICTMQQYWVGTSRLNLRLTTRLSVLQKTARLPLNTEPSNAINRLVRDQALAKEVRELVFEFTGRHLYIDEATIPGQLQLMFSDDPNGSKYSGHHTREAHEYFTQQCEPVEQSSEGTRAVVGLLVSLVTEPYRLLYIDEPELHLSPTLASRLGQEIARRCKEGALHSFVATHSPDFIKGCIESGASTQIVRLGGRVDKWSLHTVEPETVVDWMTHPLRRSARVYNGLFRDAVVVVEADSDRCFYEECTRRLASQNEGMRLENALFVNAHGKDTIREVAAPLRRVGVPCAMVFDLDAIYETNWLSGVLEACGLQHSNATRKGLETQRAALARQMLELCKENATAIQEELGLDYDFEDPKQFRRFVAKVRKNHPAALFERDASMYAAFNNFLRTLKEYGVFVCPVGEVEQWLAHLGATDHGNKWLRNVFDKMGSDPNDSSYTTPRDDDVWAFLREIEVWLKDSDRMGMSS